MDRLHKIGLIVNCTKLVLSQTLSDASNYDFDKRRRVTGAKLVAAPLGQAGLVLARPGHPDNRAQCHPDRDRRDKPGDDATSFAPSTDGDG
jgi:hypothetical protein